jgi:hypothetical protein
LEQRGALQLDEVTEPHNIPGRAIVVRKFLEVERYPSTTCRIELLDNVVVEVGLDCLPTKTSWIECLKRIASKGEWDLREVVTNGASSNLELG